MSSIKILWILLLQCLTIINCEDADGVYRVGTGISDITGTAGGFVLNGYVNPLTLAAGVHTRLHARSFIVESITTGNSVVFVSCDLGMLDHAIKLEVIKKLESNAELDHKYTEKNVMLSSTHTHSGPSGYMQNWAYLIIESYGFNPLTFWAIVDGIVDSITVAHNALQPGRVLKNKGELLEYNGNREEAAYMLNPQKERELYLYNVDKNMTLLKFENLEGEPLGCFTWWPVHPISFNNWDNPLVSSDSKGYASVLFDYQINKGQSARPGRGKFVAGFASTNLGDVSPRSPNRVNMTEQLESVRRVGTGQFQKAFQLFNDVEHLEIVKGPVDFRQQYVDMSDVTVTIENPVTGVLEEVKTCKASIGYSFIGLDPAQKEFWDLLLHIIAKPSEEMVACQSPKTIAIPAGEMHQPWEWAPSIADLQTFRLGSVDIVSAPGELTTMSGRRLKRHIEALAPEQEVIVAGLANNYINYIATPEEYELQEYEAGATIFGKYTLNAIIQTQMNLTIALNTGAAVLPGPEPETYTDRLPSKIPDLVDFLPIGRTRWGEVVSQPSEPVYTGEDLLVVFITPSLRHDPLRTKSHFLIQRQNFSGGWVDIRTDADLDTTFWWNILLKRSHVKWLSIPHDLPGTYRVLHTGFYLEKKGEPLKSFEGSTESFEIILNPQAPTTLFPETTDSNSGSGYNAFNGGLIAILVIISNYL